MKRDKINNCQCCGDSTAYKWCKKPECIRYRCRVANRRVLALNKLPAPPRDGWSPREIQGKSPEKIAQMRIVYRNEVVVCPR